MEGCTPWYRKLGMILVVPECLDSEVRLIEQSQRLPHQLLARFLILTRGNTPSQNRLAGILENGKTGIRTGVCSWTILSLRIPLVLVDLE